MNWKKQIENTHAASVYFCNYKKEKQMDREKKCVYC